MRRNARFYNLRRFLSVGLAAAMIASSQPITAFAEDGDSDPKYTVTEAKAADQAEDDTQNTSAAVTNARDSLKESISNVEDSEKNEVAALVNSLDNVAGILSEETINKDGKVVENTNSVQTNLDTAASSMEEGVAKQAEADAIAISANTAFSSYDETSLTSAMSDNSSIITDKADSVSKNVSVANNSNSRDEAYAAKESAESDYAAANAGLVSANQAYDSAKSTVDAISANCALAKEAYDEAAMKVEAAGTALNAANGEMQKAVDALGVAEANLNFLLENEKGLKAIYDQYYGLMVIYYKDTLGNNVVYNPDGTVNLDACAGKVTEKALNAEAKSPKNDNLYYSGRSLLVEEVTYMLRNEGITNFEFISKKLYTDENGKEKNNYTKEDKAALNELGFDTGKISTKDLSKGGPSLYQSSGYTTTNDNNINGRANCFFVKYTNNDGKTEYKGYNYVIKSSYDVDKEAGESVSSELESGAIFIAEVGSDRNPTAVASDYMYDNYEELEAKVTSDNYKKYQDALAAVKSAKEKVDYLRIEINNLNNCVLDKTEYNNYVSLKAQLDAAYAVLDQAENKKTDLEKKVKDAEDLLKTIDLSRFNTSSSSSSSSSNPSTGTPATTPVVTTVAQAPVQPVNELIVTGPIVTLFDDAVPLTDIPVRNTVKNTNNAKAANKTTDAKDATPKKKAAPKKATVEIAEDEVPLSAAPAEKVEDKKEVKASVTTPLADATEDGVVIAWWWWLILVVVALTIGKVSYDINKKNKENKTTK